MPSTTGNPHLSALLVLNQAKALAYIVDVLDKHDGDVNDAAVELLVSPKTIWKWLHKYPSLQISLDRIRHEVAEAEKGLPGPRTSPRALPRRVG